MAIGKETIAVAPGETIREQLKYRGMSQKEFAIRMNLSEKHVSHLINGKVELTFDVALRLEDVLGAPASFWSGLEMRYRERLTKVKQELNVDEERTLADKFPYEIMVQHKWVPEVMDEPAKIVALRKFFEVANLKVLYDLNLLSTQKNDYFKVAQKQAQLLDQRQRQIKSLP
jgi:Plasmid maintenance system antidote protein